MNCILKTEEVLISSDVEVIVDDPVVLIKGGYGQLTYCVHDLLDCQKVKNKLFLSFRSQRRFVNSRALLGTTCSLLRSMLIGVSIGFIKKLQLVGVGYRAVLEQDIVILTVGFSHVVNYKLPNGVKAICSSPVDIVLSSANKQLVGQAAADLRSIRPPESFSGKGIRYVDEILRIKEVKKK